MTIIDIPRSEYDTQELLGFEREVLGRYVSGHPLRGWEAEMASQAPHTVSQVLDDEPPDGTRVTVPGIFFELHRRISGARRPWVSGVFEDLARAIDVSFFGTAYSTNRARMVVGVPVLLDALVKRRDDQPTELRGERVRPLERTT